MASRIPILPECYTVFVTGPVSSGKSYLMKQWATRCERVLVQDIMLAFDGPEYEHIWSNPAQLCERLEQNPYYYRISHHVNSSDIANDFVWNYRAIWMLEQPRWFFIDECQEVCRVNAIHPDMKSLLLYSRHSNLGLVCSSQRIAAVDRLLTSSARMCVFFYTDEVRDLEAIRERYGNEVYEAVRGLRPCIFDDVTKVCQQEPECCVYIKGHGFRVIALGDKVAQTNENSIEGEQIEWEEISSPQPETQPPQSLEPNSGQKESESSDDISQPL
jgi:hypothetical protein